MSLTYTIKTTYIIFKPRTELERSLATEVFMKKIVLIAVMFSTVLLPAREINPLNPHFDHKICLNNRLANRSAGQTRFNKIEALEALASMNRLDVERQSKLQHLHPAYRVYYNKLSLSVRSNGHELFSNELDKQLDLSGSCEDVDSILIEITRNLK